MNNMPYEHRNIQQPSFTCGDWLSNEWLGVFAEFLSTLMLILLGCMSCIPAEGVNLSISGPFAFGFAVMFNVQIFGHISGAHMNPAVTLISVVWGKKSVVIGIIYVMAQCAGSILGYGILLALSPLDLVTDAICVTKPYPGMSTLQCLGIEIALTSALCFLVCGVWDPVNARNQDSSAIKIGLTVTGIILMGGVLTGASINPARSLGPAVWTRHWDYQWVYWLGPLGGGALAVLIYKFVLLNTSEVALEDVSMKFI